MRTIKFRAKPLSDSNVWAYGYIVQKGDNYYIVDNDNYIEVNPDTIGQYIGISDNGGTEIYEGDKLKHKDLNIVYEIVYREVTASFEAKREDKYIGTIYTSATAVKDKRYDCRVIMNKNEQLREEWNNLTEDEKFYKYELAKIRRDEYINFFREVTDYLLGKDWFTLNHNVCDAALWRIKDRYFDANKSFFQNIKDIIKRN